MTIPDSEEAASGSVTRFTLVRLLFGGAGMAFAIVAIVRTSDSLGGWTDVAPAILLLGIVLIVATTGMAARAWSAILPDGPDSRHRHIYYSAVIGKYIPGGVFQAVGQVALTSRTGLGVGRSFSSFVISAILAVVAGLLAGVGVVLIPDFGWTTRAIALAGVLLGLWLVTGDAVRFVVSWIGRLARKPIVVDALPPRRQALAAVLWNLGGLATLSAAFGLVAAGLSPDLPGPTSAAAFLVAWLVGFVAIPFPAGIGVREAVLVSLLGPWGGSGLIVTASLVHRLLAVIAEVLVFLATRLHRSRADT